MGSLPLAKAGVGSAVNDTTRQIGGALGVAIVGSVMSSTYASKIGDLFAGTPRAGSSTEAVAKNSLGGALAVAGKAQQSGNDALAGLGRTLEAVAKSAFVDGMHTGVIVAAAAAFLGAIVAAIWLPAHARDADSAEQAHEYAEEQAAAGAPMTAPDPAPGTPAGI
jgi:MFS transporter, DHA2 family, multidrug resistance protein